MRGRLYAQGSRCRVILWVFNHCWVQVLGRTGPADPPLACLGGDGCVRALHGKDHALRPGRVRKPRFPAHEDPGSMDLCVSVPTAARLALSCQQQPKQHVLANSSLVSTFLPIAAWPSLSRALKHISNSNSNVMATYRIPLRKAITHFKWMVPPFGLAPCVCAVPKHATAIRPVCGRWHQE